MKTETKAELRKRIAILEDMVRHLSEELEAEERTRWERKIPLAGIRAYNDLSRVYPRLVYDLNFVHVDKVGYWYTYQLVNDSRKQTHCVRHKDLEETK